MCNLSVYSHQQYTFLIQCLPHHNPSHQKKVLDYHMTLIVIGFG